MKKAIPLLLGYLLLFTTSCKKANWEDVPSGELPARLEGIWQSEGYGHLLQIKSGKATLYEITQISGIKSISLFDGADADVATWNVKMKDDGTAFIYKSKKSVTHYRFEKLDTMPEVARNGGTPPSSDAQLNFDILWQTFKEHYAFFEQRKVNWDGLRSHFRPQVTATNLQAVVEEMLSALSEDHVTLTTTTDDFINRFDAGARRTFARFYEEVPAHFSQKELKTYVVSEYEKIVGNLLAQYLKGDFETAVQGQLFWGSLDDKTGYLLIGQMAGYELEELKQGLDKAINDLKDKEGLVIDIRGNLGGNDNIILEAAGRFIKSVQVGWQFKARNGPAHTPVQTVLLRPTGPVQFTKPIRVLTSIATSSAAEIFTLMLRQNKHVKVVGETTNGIFSTMLNKHLPNGWQFTLSNEVLYDAAGNSYEGKGILPDIQAPFPSASDRNNGVDPALNRYKSWF